ncbi:MAG TPA: hypothetical protein VM532_01765, partial [Burkholderiales bacterium]|nr:hypothetical protein [Burkholderiales bacterium]
TLKERLNSWPSRSEAKAIETFLDERILEDEKAIQDLSALESQLAAMAAGELPQEPHAEQAQISADEIADATSAKIFSIELDLRSRLISKLQNIPAQRDALEQAQSAFQDCINEALSEQKDDSPQTPETTADRLQQLAAAQEFLLGTYDETQLSQWRESKIESMRQDYSPEYATRWVMAYMLNAAHEELNQIVRWQEENPNQFEVLASQWELIRDDIHRSEIQAWLDNQVRLQQGRLIATQTPTDDEKQLTILLDRIDLELSNPSEDTSLSDLETDREKAKRLAAPIWRNEADALKKLVAMFFDTNPLLERAKAQYLDTYKLWMLETTQHSTLLSMHDVAMEEIEQWPSIHQRFTSTGFTMSQMPSRMKELFQSLFDLDEITTWDRGAIQAVLDRRARGERPRCLTSQQDDIKLLLAGDTVKARIAAECESIGDQALPIKDLPPVLKHFLQKIQDEKTLEKNSSLNFDDLERHLSFHALQLLEKQEKLIPLLEDQLHVEVLKLEKTKSALDKQRADQTPPDTATLRLEQARQVDYEQRMAIWDQISLCIAKLGEWLPFNDDAVSPLEDALTDDINQMSQQFARPDNPDAAKQLEMRLDEHDAYLQSRRHQVTLDEMQQSLGRLPDQKAQLFTALQTTLRDVLSDLQETDIDLQQYVDSELRHLVSAPEPDLELLSENLSGSLKDFLNQVDRLLDIAKAENQPAKDILRSCWTELLTLRQQLKSVIACDDYLSIKEELLVEQRRHNDKRQQYIGDSDEPHESSHDSLIDAIPTVMEQWSHRLDHEEIKCAQLGEAEYFDKTLEFLESSVVGQIKDERIITIREEAYASEMRIIQSKVRQDALHQARSAARSMRPPPADEDAFVKNAIEQATTQLEEEVAKRMQAEQKMIDFRINVVADRENTSEAFAQYASRLDIEHEKFSRLLEYAKLYVNSMNLWESTGQQFPQSRIAMARLLQHAETQRQEVIKKQAQLALDVDIPELDSTMSHLITLHLNDEDNPIAEFRNQLAECRSHFQNHLLHIESGAETDEETKGLSDVSDDLRRIAEIRERISDVTRNGRQFIQEQIHDIRQFVEEKRQAVAASQSYQTIADTRSTQAQITRSNDLLNRRLATVNSAPANESFRAFVAAELIQPELAIIEDSQKRLGNIERDLQAPPANTKKEMDALATLLGTQLKRLRELQSNIKTPLDRDKVSALNGELVTLKTEQDDKRLTRRLTNLERQIKRIKKQDGLKKSAHGVSRSGR